jgi:Fic family protein
MSRMPCIPDSLPIENLDWQRLAPYTSKAMLALARYEGTLNGMVNAGVLLSPITSQEAVLSSRIEGTQASLSEVLRHEAGEQYNENKRGDIKEIVNYRLALLTAEKMLENRPITLQSIRMIHAMLMDDVRGGDQTPGAFRTDQNWIGPKGCTITEARFIPPSPIVMMDALQNLENYIIASDIDPLVQMAVIHAQFEIIHPFNDGNGRMGRMLIPLLLFRMGVLQRPMFYLSEYLEASDREYRDRLLAITENGDWQGWIEFFLRAINAQSESNTKKANKVHALYEQMKERFVSATHSQFAVATLDAFCNRPIINSSDFITLSGVDNRGYANRILRNLVKEGLLHIVREGSGRRAAIYAFPELINIVEGEDVF